MRGLGTVLNVVAIAAGASVGTLLGALLAGGLTGEAVRLEERLEGLGEAVKRRLGGQARFVEGFVLARIRVANLLPAVLLAPLATGLVAAAR
ncbi:MAG: DUF554 family protein [Actinomycetota bacterium]|jgi:uncharacterized membrane protein YqgA involved in biofilm formation